jgi:hypothetical protein
MSDADAYAAALDQLADPAGIAARALQRAQEADELHDRIVKAGEDYGTTNASMGVFDLTVRQKSALGVAAILAQVAELAIHVQQHDGQAHPRRLLDLGDEEDAADAARPEPLRPDVTDGPEPLACRFTALLTGESFFLGDTEVLFVPGNGWVDVSEFEPIVATASTPIRWKLTGRARSRYRDMVLVSTADGVAMALPLALVTLEPDE